MVGRRNNKTKLVRVPENVLNALERVMPSEEGFDNPQRFRVLFKSSAIRLEDFLNGKKPKQRR